VKRPVSLSRRRLRMLPVALMPFVAAVSNVARADLPTMEDPSRGGDGIIERLQNYGFDIVLLVALLVISSMFIGVCYHAYTQYSEIHTGRKTWGEFGLTAAAGAILLVIGIWLLTTATEIL
jgi:integrating conjugative element membrane protein (TIGR03745 family)